MYSVEIDKYCPALYAPKFATYEDAKRCYDAAVDFIYKNHPHENIEIRLLFQDDPIIWSIVECD